MANVLEAEIDTPRNGNLHFNPIGRKVRGRFDYNRVAEPLARMQSSRFNGPIPGQVLGIDLESGECYVRELLHESEHSVTRAEIEKSASIAPEKEPVKTDKPTFLYWFLRAVEGGLARVIKGTLPEKIDGKPRLHFHGPEPTERPEARLADSMEVSNALHFAGMSDADKRKVRDLLGRDPF